MQVDESYLAKTRKRLAASAKPQQKRKIELILDDREVNALAGGTKEAPLYVKNRQVRHLGSLLQAGRSDWFIGMLCPLVRLKAWVSAISSTSSERIKCHAYQHTNISAPSMPA